MHIEPHVHEQFVQDFGLNMLNTLTARDNRAAILRRRVHVFDERGGIMGGRGDTVQQYQNLTTGVFQSKDRRLIGVKYRCVPNDLTSQEIGAFHTHPALFDPDIDKVRRRIDQLIWLSELDRHAFRRQHELYGYEWHFIGCIDIGAFNIHDLKRGTPYPRYVFRYPKLPELMARLEPQIRHFEQILRRPLVEHPPSGTGLLTQVVQELTSEQGTVAQILVKQNSAFVEPLARQVATECQLYGAQYHQVARMLDRAFAPRSTRRLDDHASTFAMFRTAVLQSYSRAASLV